MTEVYWNAFDNDSLEIFLRIGHKRLVIFNYFESPFDLKNERKVGWTPSKTFIWLISIQFPSQKKKSNKYGSKYLTRMNIIPQKCNERNLRLTTVYVSNFQSNQNYNHSIRVPICFLHVLFYDGILFPRLFSFILYQYSVQKTFIYFDIFLTDFQGSSLTHKRIKSALLEILHYFTIQIPLNLSRISDTLSHKTTSIILSLNT